MDEVAELKAQLAEITAERDALKVQFDAVPVMQIKFYVNNTDPDYDLMMYWEDNQPVFDKAKYAIVDWLRGQV